jgi:hypothetical protein
MARPANTPRVYGLTPKQVSGFKGLSSVGRSQSVGDWRIQWHTILHSMSYLFMFIVLIIYICK